MPDSRPVEIDFIGQVVEADLSVWTLADNGDPSEASAVAEGRPRGAATVGPGTLVLDDGQRIAVPPNTPGNRGCGVLRPWCVVVGGLDGTGTTATWLVTLRLGESRRMQVVSDDGPQASFWLGADTSFALPIDPATRVLRCGGGYERYAEIGPEWTVTGFECVWPEQL